MVGGTVPRLPPAEPGGVGGGAARVAPVAEAPPPPPGAAPRPCARAPASAEFAKSRRSLQRGEKRVGECGGLQERATRPWRGERARGLQRRRVPLPERRVGEVGAAGTGGTRARGPAARPGHGRGAEPQVHPQPAETRAGGRAPAQRRVRRRSGRQQPAAAAAGECQAPRAGPWAPRGTRLPSAPRASPVSLPHPLHVLPRRRLRGHPRTLPPPPWQRHRRVRDPTEKGARLGTRTLLGATAQRGRGGS